MVGVIEGRLNRLIKLNTLLCEIQLCDSVELLKNMHKYKKRLKYIGLK